jgi:hypothetical protein
MYSIDLFGYSHQTEWKPDVNRLAIVKSMVAETYHKEAFRMVGESDRLTKLSRRRNLARFIIDLPKYIFVGTVIILILLAVGIVGDVISYLYRAPAVVAIEQVINRLYKWLFTDTGLIAGCSIIVAAVVFMKVRKYLIRIVGQS